MMEFHKSLEQCKLGFIGCPRQGDPVGAARRRIRHLEVKFCPLKGGPHVDDDHVCLVVVVAQAEGIKDVGKAGGA